MATTNEPEDREAPGERALSATPAAPEPRVVELTLRSAAAGVVFGIVFGAANAYLGLRVGLTVSTSIPIAVLTVALVWGSLRGGSG